MTVGIIFDYASEPIEVRVEGVNILFRTAQSGYFATIDGIKLDYVGVCREFPDLENASDWQKQAVERFKKKIMEFKTEMARAEYIISDLKKFGYVPMYMQQKGFRPIKL